jgi:phosphoglycerate kinase
MDKKTIRDVDVSGKRVLVRVDFNVPLDKKSGAITDDTRVRAALPTIRQLIDRGAKVILMSHLGRPGGLVVEHLRMQPVAERLGSLLGRPVQYVDECVGPAVQAKVAQMQSGDVLLLENLRFHAEEEENHVEFARQLASLGDVYVNDAFGTAHRAHASTEGVTHFLPAVAGLLMEKEIDVLGRALEHPERPFVAIMGGAKVSDKFAVIENLLKKVDRLLIGGGMANTFLAAQGHEVGKSLLERDQVPAAQELLRRASGQFGLPVDVVVADKADAGATARLVAVSEVPTDTMIVDIGPRTREAYGVIVDRARLVVWNGPMGIFEIPEFAAGTKAIAEQVAASKAVSIVGGGDSVAALEQLGLADRITLVSTGGGATLEFLEGRMLPGVAALNDK